ncbi:MAG: class I SAM-dependent methyltransferase [Anaerolineales bacterium]|nr:class I SAM-dependent methyltransferase [Anaerolineales bacterium]
MHPSPYAYTINLDDPNQSWTRLIQWTGERQRVLDVGCGRGQMGRILNETYHCRVSGLEINPAYAQECQGYEQLWVGSAEDEGLLASLPGPFDVIICGDVLEHLRQPEVPLQAFHRLLAPAGRLLISVPNVAHLRLRLMHLRGRWDYTPEGLMDRTHLRWFTLATLRALVAGCGWREAELDFTLGPNLARWWRRARLPKRWLPSTLLAAQFLLKLTPHG